LYLNKQKSMSIEIDRHISMKQNNSKKQENTFNKNRRKSKNKVLESSKLKRMTHCRKFKSNGKKRRKILMT